MDYTVTLPGGETLNGKLPIVVIGPNGSGKTRQTRNITSALPVEFVNALRNTRVAPELPVMGFDSARNNFVNQKSQARNAHWELTSEFDYMLSQLLAQQSMVAIEFMRRYEANPTAAGSPETTPLTNVERLWSEVFPGRELQWRDWKPLIKNRVSGAEIEYSGNTMSDGERAALFLAGRVFSTPPGILVVDEPETHFHTMLAVRLWNAFEDARPDLRFVYVTHDLPFALSRRQARFVLASPLAGLRTIELDVRLPSDVAEALLGSASLSFYASRVVFCEGEADSLDSQLYAAWFNGPDTVIRSVGSCQQVIRCVEALTKSDITSSLVAEGIVDGDYYADAFKASLPAGTKVLNVHEVESLFCLPGIVEAISAHVSRHFTNSDYVSALKNTVSVAQRHSIIIERWKARIEPYLASLVSGVASRNVPVADLITDLPNVFDLTRWGFSPEKLLGEERIRVESVLGADSADEILSIVPGKQLLPVAARFAGMNEHAYVSLVVKAVHGGDPALRSLGSAVSAFLQPYLPERYCAIAPR